MLSIFGYISVTVFQLFKNDNKEQKRVYSHWEQRWSVGLIKLSDVVLIEKAFDTPRLLTYTFPSLSFASRRTLQHTQNSEEIKQHLTHNPCYYRFFSDRLTGGPSSPCLP